MSGQLCVVKQQAPQLFKLAQGYTPFSEVANCEETCLNPLQTCFGFEFALCNYTAVHKQY